MPKRDKDYSIQSNNNIRIIEKSKEKNFKFILSEKNQSEILTPTYLDKVILPYLKSIENIQKIMNELNGNMRVGTKFIFIRDDLKYVKIKDSKLNDYNTVILDTNNTLNKNDFTRIISISQNSPITIELSGIDKVLNTLGDLILPSRKKLYEQERKVKILEQKQKIKKDKEELLHLEQKRKYNEEIELEKKYLELEEKKLELNEKKMNLILNFIEKTAPNLTDTQKMMYVMKMLPEFNTIISSPLELEILDKN